MWEIYDEHDRLTGETRRTVTLTATWSDAEWPYETINHVLALTCTSDSHVGAVLGYGGQYLGFDNARTEAALDEGSVHSITWNVSSGGEWLVNTNFNRYLRNDGWLDAERLVIRFSPDFSQPMTAEYDLSGIRWALDQLPCPEVVASITG